MIPPEIRVLFTSQAVQEWIESNWESPAMDRYLEIGNYVQALWTSLLVPEEPRVILEVCAGSGAGSIAVHQQFPQAHIISLG